MATKEKAQYTAGMPDTGNKFNPIITVRAVDHDDALREICSALYRPREPHRLNLYTRWKMAGEMVLMPGGVVWDNQGNEWWQYNGKWEKPSPEQMEMIQ